MGALRCIEYARTRRSRELSGESLGIVATFICILAGMNTEAGSLIHLHEVYPFTSSVIVTKQNSLLGYRLLL